MAMLRLTRNLFRALIVSVRFQSKPLKSHLQYASDRDDDSIFNRTTITSAIPLTVCRAQRDNYFDLYSI